MNLQTGDKTFVSRLRISHTGLDPLTARLRLASLFQAADVQPVNLSPSAIVCIRRLDDPRPRTISLARGNSRLPPEWQASVRASIEHLVRRAPRPARERVAADEPCVVFADQAELLAALAGDWCEHRALTRWWWRSLFKETINSGTLAKLWQQSPEYVPGALEHLARSAQATRFVAALPEDAARAILQSLTRRFALAGLETAISSATQIAPHAATKERAAESRLHLSLSGVTQKPSRAASVELEAPWRSIVPESHAHDLSLPQQCLLGLGLVLQRAPALARSRNFAHRVSAWIDARAFPDRQATAHDSSAAKTGEPRGASATLINSATKPLDAPARDAFEEQEDSRAPAHVASFDVVRNSPAPDVSEAAIAPSKLEDAREPASPPQSISAHDVATAERDEATQVTASDVGLSTAINELEDRGAREVEFEIETGEGVLPVVSSAASSDARVERREARESSESSAFVMEEEATDDARPALIAHIETRYGGLFHLINLSLFLELYGDFTSPSEPGIALPIWDFVALLGRRLGGAGVESDPIWPLLALLAGRDVAQPPGEDFAAPDEWRVPVAWLRMFPRRDVWKWTTTRGADAHSRLQIIHPAKFLVLDVPLDSEAEVEQQLARELEIYAGVFSGITLRRAARPYRLRGRDANARWVERLHAFVRARLRDALGTVDAKRAARLVCERHASVFVTTPHVDIVMRLAELPFEVRVAGLDRDPGWVPAAGRFIAFHFE
jgi:hypothetical protein